MFQRRQRVKIGTDPVLPAIKPARRDLQRRIARKQVRRFVPLRLVDIIAIGSLEPLDRSLVLLSLEGQSYAEIAALHGLSESNVGARLTRARKKLIQLTEDAL